MLACVGLYVIIKMLVFFICISSGYYCMFSPEYVDKTYWIITGVPKLSLSKLKDGALGLVSRKNGGDPLLDLLSMGLCPFCTSDEFWTVRNLKAANKAHSEIHKIGIPLSLCYNGPGILSPAVSLSTWSFTMWGMREERIMGSTPRPP